MRKGRDRGKNGEKKKTEKKENTDENSGHYGIGSSRPPERQKRKYILLIFVYIMLP